MLTRDELRKILRSAPLVASVQADQGTPLDDPQTLARLALASQSQGVRIFRAQGSANIAAIKRVTAAPIIGLIKRAYSGSDVYISATEAEVNELIETDCEVIALDATLRDRPVGASFEALVARIRASGRLVMADCDSLESIARAVELKADLVSTTLAGYTGGSPCVGPDLDLLRFAAPIKGESLLIAEGRFTQPKEALFAQQIGADAVVIGGALNDPIKQTRAFATSLANLPEWQLAIDLGGTWIRGALVGRNGEIRELEQVRTPARHSQRLEWIRQKAIQHGTARIGIASGGTIDPKTGVVSEALEAVIPDLKGHDFSIPGLTTLALNDGLATAWGHSLYPEFAGLRVLTLALGSGVGVGFVERGQLVVGGRGEYPRLNDLRLPGSQRVEDILGGINLGTEPSEAQKAAANEAARYALNLVRSLFHPDVVIVCGGVGLSDWLCLEGTVPSPYGEHAGLVGAAQLARHWNYLP